MKRIVSVYLPLWPIERLSARRGASRMASSISRKGPRQGAGAPVGAHDDSGEVSPLVLVNADGPRGITVHACDTRDMAQGVREGEALADVRARLPGLTTTPADPAGDLHALEALAQW